jgi:nitrogen fixation/metabolism regulation signal transduction histidine kinase
MPNKNCLTPVELKNDLDEMSDLLMQHYDKNMETVLEKEDETFLNEIAAKLNKLAKDKNVEFNKEGFKTFIRKLFVYDLLKFGGDGGDVVPYSKKNKNAPNKSDFVAIVMLIACIFILYISFLKFKDLTEIVSGMSLGEISSDIQTQVTDAITKIRELPTEQVTFVKYIWSSIQTFSCSIVETQTSRIKNIVTESLSNMVTDFTSVATETCIPRTEVFSEGAYTVSSSYIGNIDLGKTLNTLVQTASAYSTQSATSSCVANTALSLQRRAMEELFHQRTLLLNQISAQSSQAINFFTYGAYMGTTSVMYLTYRTKELLGIAMPMRQRKQIEGGSKKYTRKNKKTNRKKYSKNTNKKR